MRKFESNNRVRGRVEIYGAKLMAIFDRISTVEIEMEYKYHTIFTNDSMTNRLTI